MFVCNISLNKKKAFKVFFIIIIILMLVFFCIGVYKILNKANSDSEFKVADTIKQENIVEITSDNYTNILKAVHEDINSYVGINIRFTGYVYRLIDFDESEFVLARNMIISSDYQAVIVGFLCNYEKANDFPDNTWVEVTGTIIKGNYHGEIPVIQVTEINETTIPNDEYVYPPDDSYIPTSSLL